MNELIPNPEPEDAAADPADGIADGNADGNSGHRSRRRNQAQILNEQQCLSGISQLPGLLLTNFVKPAQSNAIRAALNDLLGHHRAQREQASGTLATENMMAAIRQNPALLNVFEPLLTDEQFDMIMDQIKDDPRGQA